jgi:hypothetical protein
MIPLLWPRGSSWIFGWACIAGCASRLGCNWVRLPQGGTSHVHHNGDVSNNRTDGSSKGANVFSIRYCLPLVRTNCSDLCAIRTVEINLSTHMRIVWRQGKANINRLLGNASPGTRITHGTTYPLPHELVEMIIAHITHDFDALKAFSFTCRSWYIAAVPHLHHTLTLADDTPNATRGKLKPLSQLHQLGLMPLAKEIRVDQRSHQWFTAQRFSRRDLRYFSAFTNVHTIRLGCLDISRFMPGVERYFGHFSPTLRSITFFEPRCTPRQLSHFLSHFPNLDDIKICGPIHTPSNTIPDPELVPFPTPRLRGWLVLHHFDSVVTWTRLIAAGSGLRFRCMELYGMGGGVYDLSEAYAETLETLRFYAMDGSGSE